MSEQAEEGIPTAGKTQAMQQQRRHQLQHQQHFSTSMIRTPTCPNPTLVVLTLTYSAAPQTTAALSFSDRNAWQTQSLWQNLTHTRWVMTSFWLRSKGKYSFFIYGFVDHTGLMAGRGSKMHSESELRMGVLWINQLCLFSPPPPSLPSALLNTPPVSLKTRACTHTRTHRPMGLPRRW